MNNEEKSEDVNSDKTLGTKSVKKLFVIYTVLAIVGMAPQILQVILDGFFVGSGIGVKGLATMGIVGSLLTMQNALSALWGFGGATLVGLKLGERNVKEARHINGQAFWHALIMSILISAFVLLNLDNVARWLGATGEIVESTKAYIRVFMIGFPFTTVGASIYYNCRVDEQTTLPTLAFAIPGLIAPIAEYFFIMKLHMGIAGSAAAFVISVGPSFLLVLYFIFGKTQLKIRIGDIKPDFKVIKKINVVGFCQCATQIAVAAATVFINNLLGKYGGQIDTAAFGITNSYFLYILMLLISCCNAGLQPIASYNYGGKLYSRVHQLLKSAIIYTISFFVAINILVFVFPNQIIGVFAAGNTQLVQASKYVIRYFIIAFPLGGVTLLISSYYQSIEQNGKATFQALTRSFIFLIPLLLILPKFLGVTGIWMSQTSADILAFIVGIIFVIKELKRLKNLENQNV